jgi:hypothetical protein
MTVGTAIDLNTLLRPACAIAVKENHYTAHKNPTSLFKIIYSDVNPKYFGLLRVYSFILHTLIKP